MGDVVIGDFRRPASSLTDLGLDTDEAAGEFGDVMQDLAEQDIDRHARCSRCNTKLWCRTETRWIRRHNIACQDCG